jgi:hypothetical protein
MPIKKCKVKNRSGFKAGSRGKCYIGKSAHKKAVIQNQAIHAKGIKPNRRKK